MEAAEAEAEATVFHGGAGRLSTDRRLVPWSSWAEWRFVRDGLFSPFPALLFAGSGMAEDDTLESEEMLAMLYSMAIMRLVNGFVENTNKKTGHSIAEFAEAVGLPRVLVDIRHGMSKLRFKPAYNPYTEPSMKIFSYHEGLKKWVEVGNSGMFRPEMLLPMGLPEGVNVIAWGLSLERYN